MFALIRLLFGRIAKKRLKNSKWLGRIVLLVAIIRWITQWLDRPQVVRLRKNESATISIRQTGSNHQ